MFQIGLEGIGFDWFLFAGIIVAYLLSSIIFHSFSRISPEMKDRFKQSLSMTKGRYIVMILGWLTIFPVFMHFISGMVGGLVNFTPMMHFSYGAGEFLAIILLPLSMFTFYVLFPFNMMLVWIFYFVTKVQIGMGGFTIVPEDLTIAGIIMMIPLLLIEWFIVSHAIVSFFNRIRNRFQKKDRSIPP